MLVGSAQKRYDAEQILPWPRVAGEQENGSNSRFRSGTLCPGRWNFPNDPQVEQCRGPVDSPRFNDFNLNSN